MTYTSSNGLAASIWASGRSHIHTTPRHVDPRSRSVPPQASSNSLLAPAAPNPTAALSSSSRTTTSLAPVQALHRLEQTCLRLRWKSVDLERSWQRTSPEEAAAHGFDAAVAERNFKLDFYEFYAWIEQALVLLQRIFGVEILSGGGGGKGGGGWHAYHHNVLTALGDVDNPLHEVLGMGDVNHALWKAKELRNRWKDAAGEGEGASTTTPPTRMYDLRWILGQILSGLEAAYVLAREKVHGQEKGDVSPPGVGAEDRNGEGWEWMVEEQMDWEP
ncbi:hypothetical protein ACRE_066280 [Hapsidospora chrysogenum ATCC 11550]|uniref:Uncharacterized protein n=1 Tax=Hapsidospora chrysogenum (strain ATCC 11550 / CBS 779.69 / DSM 880 / IAM 14645 / JCM 23072 / IMI 49137) TaxID=857340 RepID=A0A086SZU7_HAPC1|nr:hypothetical protein ACRE_066280 [Hapsidospora chrysogenum ATCC 11550]